MGECGVNTVLLGTTGVDGCVIAVSSILSRCLPYSVCAVSVALWCASVLHGNLIRAVCLSQSY